MLSNAAMATDDAPAIMAMKAMRAKLRQADESIKAKAAAMKAMEATKAKSCTKAYVSHGRKRLKRPSTLRQPWKR